VFQEKLLRKNTTYLRDQKEGSLGNGYQRSESVKLCESSY